MRGLIVGALLLAFGQSGFSEEMNSARALYNYQMSCQGCHGPDGLGGGGVPRMQGFVGLFLNTAQGRDFLVQVPGSANSVLNNLQLAEVLNWMIIRFGGASNPPDLVDYTAQEVGDLRKAPLNEVDKYRAGVLANIMFQKNEWR